MPIHDLSYRRFDGERTSWRARVWALARSVMKTILKRRLFLMLLAVCWIPAVARAAQIYAARQFPQMADWLDVSPILWQEFLTQQVRYMPVLLVSLYTGAGAIASDLSSGALVIYLSKPISRMDYLVAKAIPVLAAVGVITVVPGLALLILQLSVAGNMSLLNNAPGLPFSIIGYSLWINVFFGLTVLAVSSLSRSARVAGAGYAALVLGSDFILNGVMARFVDVPAYLTMTRAAEDAGHLFFGTEGGESPLTSTIGMAVLCAFALYVIQRRLRSAEVGA